MVLPRPGTSARVIFRAPTLAEREEIARLEKEVAKEPPPPKHEHEEHK
jgi:hypothetical protein